MEAHQQTYLTNIQIIAALLEIKAAPDEITRDRLIADLRHTNAPGTIRRIMGLECVGLRSEISGRAV
ncbi:MAG: hypothetical protein COA84_15190 [Robiginitomaculum sp.]|nr:MAG: hypothetical protein COA84_15190 [Robiginitomaculum sp.]